MNSIRCEHDWNYEDTDPSPKCKHCTIIMNWVWGYDQSLKDVKKIIKLSGLSVGAQNYINKKIEDLRK